MNKAFIILGQGGHARVLLDVLYCLGHRVAGLLTPDQPAGAAWEGVPVLGDDRWLDSAEAGKYVYAVGVGLMPNRQALRAGLYHKLRARGLDVPSLVHPSAVLAQDVRLGSGAQVMAGVIIQPGTVIAENALLNTGAQVDHHCRIGRHAHVAPGAVLCGGVRLGDDVFVGAGATLIQNISIGDGAVVAAGSTVLQDIEPGSRFIPRSSPC